ncbi:COP9 signalosome complex subunit 8 [Camellia lanceoleosa]|nr:COP9 signalosome complex subunit 8 [Camellia lanceoleosa]
MRVHCYLDKGSMLLALCYGWIRNTSSVSSGRDLLSARGSNWDDEWHSDVYTTKMFKLLLAAYSTISIQDVSLFLGMNEDDATNFEDDEDVPALGDIGKLVTVRKKKTMEAEGRNRLCLLLTTERRP